MDKHLVDSSMLTRTTKFDRHIVVTKCGVTVDEGYLCVKRNPTCWVCVVVDVVERVIG